MKGRNRSCHALYKISISFAIYNNRMYLYHSLIKYLITLKQLQCIYMYLDMICSTVHTNLDTAVSEINNKILIHSRFREINDKIHGKTLNMDIQLTFIYMCICIVYQISNIKVQHISQAL